MKRIWIIWIMLVLFADMEVGIAQNNISSTYQYNDTFSSDKAEHDSYTHSQFGSSDVTVTSRPTLTYRYIGNDRVLSFNGVNGEPAHLGYCFPVDSPLAEGAVYGYLDVDVAYEGVSGDRYISISVSADGSDWSGPQFLSEGSNRIDLSSDYGACYLILTGNQASVDNLYIELNQYAATWYVPQDFPTIQDAINQAQDEDIIEVASGEYSGPGNVNIDFQGKAITVQGTNATLRCDSTDGQVVRGFYFHNNEGPASVLRGFTIIGARVYGSTVPSSYTSWRKSSTHPIGAGIFCEFASPTITDCYIYDCSAEVGGGIGCVGGEPTITSCRFENNSARMSGAGMALIRACRAKVTYCTTQANDAYQDGLGAGIYINDESPASERNLNNNYGIVFQHCNILLNGTSGTLKGGGIYIAGSATNVRIQNSLICKNTAQDGSAVYYMDGAAFSEPLETSEDVDLALYLVNCTIANNVLTHSTVETGAVTSWGSRVYIRNSILWDNDGNSILWDNDYDALAYNSSQTTYNNIQVAENEVYPGLGNINEDPLFANVNGDDFHLRSRRGRYDDNTRGWISDSQHSTCIDAGEPRDPIGQEESPNGSCINMGAYGGTNEASKGGQVYHVSKQGRVSNSGLSRDQAFLTISRAISATINGDTILVWPGEYQEQISFQGKAIRIQSISQPAVISFPGGTAIWLHYGEGRDTVISNFIIKNSDVGIYCNGPAVRPTITNLSIVGNRSGIQAVMGAQPSVSNCVFWDNMDSDLFSDPYSIDPCYCCIERAYEGAQAAGEGNINRDPLFDENGDYTLKSQYGRFSFESGTWVYDSVTSPCIDAGDPEAGAKGEPFPNGGHINMGAYGGAPYASKSASDTRGVDVTNFENNDLNSQTWLDLLPWTSYKYDIISNKYAQIFEETISSDTDVSESNTYSSGDFNGIAN